MKRSLLCLVSICVISFTGCGKDDAVESAQGREENPMPEGENPDKPEGPEDLVYFTFTARNEQENSALTRNTWITVHDSNGELLGYKKAEPGATLVFESEEEPVTDQITVSLVTTSQSDSESAKIGDVNTYREIDRGTVWAQRDYGIEKETSKDFTFEATNVPEWSMFSVSSQDSFTLQLSDSYSFEHPDVQEGNLLLNEVHLNQDEDFIFSLINTQGTAKYQR
ncbi:MAG: hypothetical protein WA913_05105, partial [Pricia sp.]